MIVILSPAKNMKEIQKENIKTSKPIFKEKTEFLHKKLKLLEPWEIESLMKVNPEIAMKSFAYFNDFSFELKGYPAIFSYNGLAYKNINPDDFTDNEINFSNNHIRIISAFYGIIKACDEILPYRLDFNNKFKINNMNLYKFWGNLIYNETFKTRQPVINLSSSEYYKTIIPFLKENDTFITIDFLNLRKGKLVITPTAAKMARGQMTRYIIKNKITSPEYLKKFEWNGYEYEKSISDNKKYVFIQN